MLKGFPLSHIWVEFHCWSLPVHRGGCRRWSHWDLEGRDVGPSTKAGGEGCLGTSPPPCTGGLAWQRAHLSPHLPSPSSAARSEQPSPAGHPGEPGSPQPPPGPSASSSFPAASIHPPSPGFAGMLSPHCPFHAGHHLRPPLPCVLQGWWPRGCRAARRQCHSQTLRQRGNGLVLPTCNATVTHTPLRHAVPRATGKMLRLPVLPIRAHGGTDEPSGRTMLLAAVRAGLAPCPTPDVVLGRGPGTHLAKTSQKPPAPPSALANRSVPPAPATMLLPAWQGQGGTASAALFWQRRASSCWAPL